MCRGSSIRTGERVDCSPVSLHVSKPSLRANYFKVPVGLPGNGRFWCVIQAPFNNPLISLLGRQDSNLQPDRYERTDLAEKFNEIG